MSVESRSKKPNQGKAVLLHTYFIAFQTSGGVESGVFHLTTKLNQSEQLRRIEEELSKQWAGPRTIIPAAIAGAPPKVIEGPVKIVMVSALGATEAQRLEKPAGEALRDLSKAVKLPDPDAN
jgi:NhaP-type Na+/H+ or K+/H+ antiporter